MKVLTVISDPVHLGFVRLKMSCVSQGLDLIAIDCSNGGWTNNRTKDILLRNYLTGLDGEEVVLFSDGYDTMMLAGEEEILEKFEQEKTDLLVSAEANCFPDKSLQDLYPPSDTIYRYLNCGGFIGRVKAIRDFLCKEVADPGTRHDWSNQYIWTLKYLQDTRQLKLDTRCEIFCTFYTIIGQFPLPDDAVRNRKEYTRIYQEWFQQNFVVRNDRIFNKLTETWPCNVHFNGVSSLFLDDYKILVSYEKLL
ncbi:MAG TPA: hypothetical protein VL832_01600 [Puia sp.]|nr:hypothetical protein [Puia sp.]